jgi:phosphoadenosine phosphosulfate reductase
METLEELRRLTTELPASQMLELLIKEKFPNEAVVTASLKSPSVVVLKMISELDSSIPVIFCHPQNVFPESEKYRDDLVKLLGLSNIKLMTRGDPLTGNRAFERYERLVCDAPNGVGSSKETIHLHDTLSPFKCWIKAVYHDKSDEPGPHRVNVHGGMVIVDVLRRRTTEMVDRFMQEHGLPHHPKIRNYKKPVQVMQSSTPDIGSYF